MYLTHVARMCRALGLLSSPGGTTIRQMEASLGLSRRTVYRFLDALERMGFPVYEEPKPSGHGNIWRLQEQYVQRLPNLELPRVDLRAEERLLLAFLLQGAGILHKTELAAPMASLRSKLSALFGTGSWDSATGDALASLFVRTRPLAKDYSGKEDLIELIVATILERVTCVTKYHALSTAKVSEFRVDPLRLVEHRGGLYLFVRVTQHGRIRILAVDRIQDLTSTDSTFVPPEDFDAEALLESAFDLTFGDPIAARIWISPEAAPYVMERRWAATQSTVEQPDGSIVLSLETSGFQDLKRWVLGFGPRAKVLDPAELAKAVRDEARLIAKAYGRSRR